MNQLRSLTIRIRLTGIIVFIFFFHSLFAQQDRQAVIRGSVKDSKGDPVEFATVYIKETQQGTQSDSKGDFLLLVAPGSYTFCVQLMGYETHEQSITVQPGEKMTIPVELAEKRYALQEVVIEAKSAVQRINESAYNAVALDARVQHNSTANLSGMLNKVSGVRIRETGGVGSEMQVMMDGFSGKHVKVFIDGVPQDGVGQSFGLNNIPVNYAERIEIYKGVVPVEFGTDAIGGVINIVTRKGFNKKWHLDASYSYGSFNTHKSYFNFGQTFDNGLTYEVNAFQNYSDNNYYVDTPVKEFLPDGGSSTDRSKIERVKRFHDTYHNEAISGKVGLVDKPWADRLIFGLTYSQVYKELQTGVRQEIVFGGKYRKGHSVMPSLEYNKRNLFVNGLDVTLTANYNKNSTHNVDTSAYEFNWRGEKRPRAGMPGEQSYMHLQSDNNNWNGTLSARYRLKDIHSFTFNHIINSFRRSNRSLLTPGSDPDPIPKETQKNVSGLSYQLMPNKRWNASLFGKYYYQHVAGPVATSSSLDEFVRTTKTISTTGYGAAGTYFILDNLQAKVSYEKVYRLPANNEVFGDEDLESGDIGIRPENSHNINFNVSFDESFGKHAVYLEGSMVYRDIKDYIQRNITGLSGGRYGAAYINHGKVLTKGYTLTARYNFSNLLSVGGNFTEINTRDNVATTVTGAPSNTYKARMPNVPYLFANADITFYRHDLGATGNVLTVSYDNFYVKSFPLYSEVLGSSDSKSVVPTQFSHNVSVSYSLKEGRYNISFECQNLTNEKLYDNFSLQKAGRAFYGKVRVSL
ncbi:TonB-dependent receptor [uncultured Proteiniphilum sp.]|uniref:TonB-dependent receptor n=1 Tax=uncultured Proteiniphilum sp. TaxID=497637 RepID=UPI002616E4AB|nr:TonB-dependent receptor [uncultured Proteiniphilum sp.]